MGVKFMREPCQKALQARLVQTIKEMQKIYLAEVQSHMKTTEGARDLKEGEIKALAGWITAQVIGGPWATVDAFGTGSKMDTSNPALNDYLFNPDPNVWNPDRHDLAIRSRKGPYVDIFGRKQEGSRVGGINLEKKYPPMEPSHAFTTAMAWMQIGTIQKMLKDAIATFPLHQFIVATRE